MKRLTSEQVLSIIDNFIFDKKLSFVGFIDFEPDCKVYILQDDNSNKYALILRDFPFDELEAEKRILSNELGIVIIERFVTKDEKDYWYIDRTFDTFQYVFSLSRIKMTTK